MRRSRELIKQTEEQIRLVLAQTDYKLESMDGINVVTASGIAPIRFSLRQRNPLFYEFYQRKLSEGKMKEQVLICIMKRLVNIIYSMMKNKNRI
jgi:hypothetical protein